MINEMIILTRSSGSGAEDALEGGIQPDNPVNEYCFFEFYQSQQFKDVDVLVKKDGCDFENCGNWSYNDVEVQLIRQFNNYEVLPDSFISICSLSDTNRPVGQSTPVSYERIRKDQSGNWVNSWNLLPCKTPDEKIEFRIVDKDGLFTVPIYADFIADVCYSIIANDGLTLINDTTELKNQNIIKNPQIAFNDICGHYCYPQQLTTNGYVLKEVTELHELLHLSQYQKIINNYRISVLVENLKKYSFSCKDYKKFFNNIDQVSIEIKSIIWGFVYASEIKYAQDSGIEYKVGGQVIIVADSVKELKNEKNIQSNEFLKKLIDDYHKALHNAWGTPYPVQTCKPCPI